MPITFPLAPASLTVWNRVEPRPRSSSFGASLAAQVRDPAWFLARQWQMGEAQGEDAGSLSFVSLSTTTTPMDKWFAGDDATAQTLNTGQPFERQAFFEPFPADDLSLQVQIGQLFDDLLARQVAAATTLPNDPHRLTRLTGAVHTLFPLVVKTDRLNPFDTSTSRFLTICATRGFNGAALYAAAKVGTGSGDIPDAITTDAGEKAVVFAAYQALASWVASVWGDVGTADPATWMPGRLEYKAAVAAGASGASTTMVAYPDADGELHWSSFDVTAQDAGAVSPPVTATVISSPIHLRFGSMPSPRFWDFETNDTPLPSVKVQTRDLAKLLSLDFMLIHGEDWFVLPFPLQVGSIARVDSLVVTDVFGGQTLVKRADLGTQALPGPTRFSLFSSVIVDAKGVPGSVAGIYVSPPSAGPAMQISKPREEVRFARDDNADMAWGVERIIPNAIGEPRPGRERDAAVDNTSPVEPAISNDTSSPLRYLVETKIPVNYIPLLGVPVQGTNTFVLQRGANVRPQVNPGGTPTFTPVPPAGKILRPDDGALSPYNIVDEEVPRTGLIIQRAVYRTRWIDGSTHLWMARRRRAGAGEAQSGLRFDQPLDTGN
jgi:hypothetical protein